MKIIKLFFICSFFLFQSLSYAQANNWNTGVYANQDCELLLTDKSLLFFERNGENITATFIHFDKLGNDQLKCNVWSEVEFDKKEVVRKSIRTDIDSTFSVSNLLAFANNTLKINANRKSQTLYLIEKLHTTPAYDMPKADKFTIGDKLQEWRIGTTLSYASNSVSFEAGTNKHDYCFIVQDGFYYCRAARIRSNNFGTLFAQNIRLISKSNGHTASMPKNNFEISKAYLVLDNSKFNPNECVFDKDGIYWSLIKFTPEKIFLNGCGETYTWERATKNSNKKDEWFAFVRYE